MIRHHQANAQLQVLFGGPHSSEPRFSRFGVKPGDYIYPVHLLDGVLYVLGRMKVRRLMPLIDYLAENRETFGVGEKREVSHRIFQNWLEAHPEMRYLAWTCSDEVVLGEEGTTIRFDVSVPSILMERLRFRSRRGERGLKHLVDGRLKSSISLQGGIYRLSEESAALFESLLLHGPKETLARLESTNACNAQEPAGPLFADSEIMEGGVS
jgi:hypothetical protein